QFVRGRAPGVRLRDEWPVNAAIDDDVTADDVAPQRDPAPVHRQITSLRAPRSCRRARKGTSPPPLATPTRLGVLRLAVLSARTASRFNGAARRVGCVVF